MPHKPDGKTTTLAGTTWTAVAGPPSGALRHSVVSLLAFNLDDQARSFSLRKKGGVTTMLVDSYLIGAGLRDQLIKDGMIVLAATDETLEMRTDATGHAFEPVVEAAFMEWSA